MSRKIIAIDVSDGAVNAVVVQSRIKGNWVEKTLHLPVEAHDNFEDGLARALETIAEQVDVRAAGCVVSVPLQFISFRNLSIPFKDKKKIRQVLPFELENVLPYAPEDIVADFHLLEMPHARDGADILVAAIERQRLTWFLELLKTHGIDPDIVTAGGFALSQCLNRFMEETKVQLLLQIDEKRTTLAINRLGRLEALRSFSGTASDEDGIQSLVLNVRRTLAALEETSGTVYEIDEVWLSGPESGRPEVGQAVEKALGTAVTPLNLMTYAKEVVLSSAEADWQAPSMNAALALAVAEVSGIEVLNFRQGRFAVPKAWMEHKKDFVKTGILALFILMLFLTNGVIDYYSTQKRADEVQKEMMALFQSTFPEVTKIVDPLHQMRQKLEELNKGDPYADTAERPLDAIEILNDVSRFIPKEINVALNSIIIGSDSILISGDTDTFNAVDDMKSELEKAEAFKAVAISSANMDKSGARVRFKLKISI